MDDLYNNAWGDPVNPETASTSFGSSQPSWTSPKLSHDLHDDESDLAAPSWSTGTGIKWNEPSEDDHGFAWSHTEPDLAWTSSTYETIQIGKLQSTHALEEPSSPDADEREIEVTPHQSPRLDQEPLRVQEETTPREEFKSPSKPPISPVQSPTPSRSPSPDGFGTFTSGFVAADDAVSPDPAFQLGDDSWGSAWAGDVGSEAEEKAEVEDEWDVAKRRKEQQDRVVPPEVLDELRSGCETLCAEMWPDTSSPFVNTDMDSWQNRIRSGMEGIEGLETLRKELLPQLILQPPPKFGKTAIAKHMAKEIHLTRNLPLVKDSPMSHYLASKGSTAWEQAVKGRKEITEDDVVPVGWRILEKEAQSPVMGTSKTQKSGGFFSFLNRRDSKVSISAAAVVNRSQSPASTSKATAPSERAASSTRGSQDSRRSISIARISEVAAPSSTVASPAPSTPPVALPSTHPSTLSTANSVPQTPSSGGSYADAPDPVFERTQSPPPAPSAVSRFLGRFSRRRTAVPTSSPHASIALSSDDLEFLSDIVPSVTDDPADDPLEQLTRSSVMRAEPLPPILPPPPLAPPSAPPSSFPPPRSHSITKNGAIPPPSLVPTQIGTSKASPTQAPSQTNGLDSFFDTWESEALGPEKPISSSRSSTPKSMGSSPLQPIPATKLPPSSSRPHSPAAFALPPHNSRPTSPSPLNHGLSVVRPPSQPLLPPPPSSGSQSLSTTSIPPQEGSAQLVASGLRPLSRSSSIGRSGSHQSHPLRPKVPLSFTIPPPPSSQRISSASSSTSPDSPKSAIESALPTPTSARPLSELYPDAVRRNNGPAPPSLATNPHPSSSFVIPPPPSQSHTLALLDTTFPHSRPAPPPLPLLAPPLSQAAPATSFDDDDFSDFQSSATVPSSNPPLAAPVFNTLPQGSAQSATLPGPSSFLTPLPPPPKSSTGSSWAPGTPSRSITLANNFSSFRSPSPSPVRPHASPSSDFDSSFTSNHSNQGLLPHPSTPSSFDDWDSFNTNPLRTPSPPRLPSKTRASFPAPPAGASSHGLGHSTKPKTNLRIVSTSSPPGSPKMRNREAEHQHTLSLVEMAAARQGQWPAPPSPLPPPLAYPFPATGKSAKHAVDLISDLDGDDNDKGDIANSGFGVGEIDESFGKFGSSDGLMVSSSVSSPAMLNPARPSMFSSTSSSMVPPNFSQSQSLQTVSSTGSNQWLLNTTGPSLTNGNGTKGSSNAGGGLSAQDLSFFEGL